MTQQVNMQVLEQMKNGIARGKELLSKAEGRLDGLNQQKENIVAQIKTAGVEPENINEEIQKLEAEMNTLYQEALNLVPSGLMNN